MNFDDRLRWTTTEKREILSTPVFDVYRQHEISATGIEGDYIAVDAPHWVVVIPKLDDKFIMVRQWRHAAGEISIEFPGGVGEPGEDPEISATRELEEETGYRAHKMTHLGTFGPNPALFSNQIHFYLAEELEDTGKQNLDADEVLEFLQVPVDEVIDMCGRGEFSHVFMAAALGMYIRERML